MFLNRSVFSIIAGFCGMTVATRANVRTANAAKEKGMAAVYPLHSVAVQLWDFV